MTHRHHLWTRIQQLHKALLAKDCTAIHVTSISVLYLDIPYVHANTKHEGLLKIPHRNEASDSDHCHVLLKVTTLLTLFRVAHEEQHFSEHVHHWVACDEHRNIHNLILLSNKHEDKYIRYISGKCLLALFQLPLEFDIIHMWLLTADRIMMDITSCFPVLHLLEKMFSHSFTSATVKHSCVKYLVQRWNQLCDNIIFADNLRKVDNTTDAKDTKFNYDDVLYMFLGLWKKLVKYTLINFKEIKDEQCDKIAADGYVFIESISKLFKLLISKNMCSNVLKNVFNVMWSALPYGQCLCVNKAIPDVFMIVSHLVLKAWTENLQELLKSIMQCLIDTGSENISSSFIGNYTLRLQREYYNRVMMMTPTDQPPVPSRELSETCGSDVTGNLQTIRQLEHAASSGAHDTPFYTSMDTCESPILSRDTFVWSGTADMVLLRRLVLVMLKGCAVYSRGHTVKCGDHETHNSQEYDVMSCLRDLDKIITATKSHSPMKYHSHACGGFSWASHMFSDQDDDWMEALLCLLDIQLLNSMACCVTSGHHSGPYSLPHNLYHQGTFLNGHALFLQFLHSIDFDHSVLMDLLCSPETCCLLYLTKYIKHVLQEWQQFLFFFEIINAEITKCKNNDQPVSTCDHEHGINSDEETTNIDQVESFALSSLNKYYSSDSDSSDIYESPSTLPDTPNPIQVTTVAGCSYPMSLSVYEDSVLDTVMSTLIRVRITLERVEGTGLAVFNIKPLLRLMNSLESAYEAFGNKS